ncbi:hypothetical protein HDE_14449 [Halotydeus destructor]|nr:hypothetical protein HDE_14449 [Halotydeus destructor]
MFALTQGAILGSAVLEEDNLLNDAAEKPATNNPVLISKPITINVRVGERFMLPCEFQDKGEHFVRLWKQLPNKILFAGNMSVIFQDTIHQIGPEGELVVNNATLDQAGVYECSISTTPKIELRHTVAMFPASHIFEYEKIAIAQDDTAFNAEVAAKDSTTSAPGAASSLNCSLLVILGVFVISRLGVRRA